MVTNVQSPVEENLGGHKKKKNNFILPGFLSTFHTLGTEGKEKKKSLVGRMEYVL